MAGSTANRYEGIRVKPDGKLKGRPVSVLLADDDGAMRSLINDELQDEGYSVFQVADGHDALDCVDDCSPDLILTDLRMPHGGFELVARFRARAPKTPIILMTAFGDATTEAMAYEKGASAYFNKPVRMGDLKTAIHRLLGDGRVGD
jgi:DNA-binding response OmpR family regulator